MTNPYVAEIRIFAFNFAPRGWLACNGQLLPLSQNTALFSLIGTYYGGDGKTTFGLPNMQGNIAVHQGQGVGLSQYVVGESGGTASVQLTLSEMPSHRHPIQATTATANSASPNNAVYALGEYDDGQGHKGPVNAYSTATANSALSATKALAINGSGQPHNNMMPYLTLNFCICMQGVFPARN